MPESFIAAPTAYAAFDMVAIATSLGGVDALGNVLEGIPRDFPASIAIVHHVSAKSSGVLPRILARRSALPVAHAEEGERLLPGRVYVAPPDQHLFITRERCVSLVRSRHVKFSRPAADPLLVSAAMAYGPRTLGIVLTGLNTDGAAGTQAIKWSGGMMLAQDRGSSRAFGMPGAAIATGCVDLVLPIEAMAHALVALVMAPGAADFLRVPLQAA